MRYEFLEHTADAKFRAYGKTLEEAFGNAAVALFNVMVDTKEIAPKLEKKIAAEGQDKQALLVNFLGEFVFLLDTENFLLHDVKDVKIEGNKITATAIGDTYSEKYETQSDVKAVTYNDMQIVEEKGNCSVQVVVDI